MGAGIAPVFKPLGLSDWRIPAALISGFTAKEAVISTLAVMSGATVETLGPTLAAMFTTPSAVAFLVYVLVYTPCVAAVTAARNEFGNWRDTWIMIAFQLLAAWLAAFIAYRIALLWSISSIVATIIIIVILLLPVVLNYRAKHRESRKRAV